MRSKLLSALLLAASTRLSARSRAAKPPRLDYMRRSAEAPADVYFGRDKAIISRRERIKKRTIKQRRLAHQRHAA